MPYKEWALGEEVLAADFNSNIARQVVPVFATVAARTAGIPVPTIGQLSYITSQYGSLDFYDGAAWRQIEGSSQRAGNAVVTSNASGSFSIAWTTPVLPVAAPGADLVLVTMNGDNASAAGVYFDVTSLTSTGFTAKAWKGGTTVNSAAMRVMYLIRNKTLTS